MSTTTLHLCRHGNTFGPDDRVIWVGKGQDLPLVASGYTQAESLASTMYDEGVIPDMIYCSSLRRTRDYALVLQKRLAPACPIIAHSCLDELDYGSWGGLTTEEVVARFGQEPVDSWQSASLFPRTDQGAWGDNEGTVMLKVRTFLKHYHEDISALPRKPEHVVIVSSNGVLRFFLHLVPGAFETAKRRGDLKMKTGGRRIIQEHNGDFSLP